MPTIQVEAQVSGTDLLRAVEQLNPAEFQQFMANVLSLRAKRQAPQLSATETELLLQINQGLPDELRNRYECLIQKRQNETLSAGEHQELLQFTQQVENLEATRMKALVQLAQLRKSSLPSLMKELGIQPASHG